MCIINRNIYTTYGLNEILDREEKVIIYGVGVYGKKIADYIISMGKQAKIEAFYVTDKKEDYYRNIKILDSEEWHLVGGDRPIIIAVSHVYLSEIVGIVQQYGREYYCVTEFLYDEVHRKSVSGSISGQIGTYEGLDFLLAGFVKCGTTTLYQVLKNVEDVYVSENKESLFFNWCDQVKNPKEQLIRDYFGNIQKEQIVGAIEPSFAKQAVRVREFFGKRVKILFMVRNPVYASFSLFKMVSRGGATGVVEAYKKCGGKYKKGVFEEFCKGQSAVRLFKYSDYIKQFQECWTKEQIKVVLFEEMIQNPRKIINEILQFIGSSCEYNDDNLPQENEGNYVMADIDGLEVASRKSKLHNEYYYFKEASGRSRDVIMNEFVEAEKQYNKAEKIYDLKLSEDERKMMEAYYNDSVRELEKVLNRNLSEMWF